MFSSVPLLAHPTVIETVEAMVVPSPLKSAAPTTVQFAPGLPMAASVLRFA
jgi:hypothetical protein